MYIYIHTNKANLSLIIKKKYLVIQLYVHLVLYKLIQLFYGVLYHIYIL